MKISTPIPPRLIDALMATIQSTYDNTDVPDGAWFQMIEDDCAAFMKRNKLKGCAYDAVHQMLEVLGRAPL